MSDVLKEKTEIGRERSKTRWGVKRKINKYSNKWCLTIASRYNMMQLLVAQPQN